MLLIERYIILLIFIVSALYLHAQNQIGINPPSIKWQTFSTEDGRYIFPAGLDSQALRTAFLVNYLRQHDSSVAGDRVTKPMPVIFQNQSTLPAGFAIPAPWRFENYLMPPQNQFLGPVTWLDILTIHEYRHAQQFWMANQGFTRIYQILMGQTGWLVNSLFTQPLWYREGDATAAETGFTNAGRGSLPSFHMEYRALLMNDIVYSYEKMNSFSFKDFTPNLYRTGYYMTIKGRRDYGNDLWVNILNDVYQKKGFFYPFSRSLKKFTGYSSREFYMETIEELDSLWSRNDNFEEINDAPLLTERENNYTSWRFPKYINDSTLVAEKSSFEQIRTYYLLHKNNKSEKLLHPGQYTSDHVMLSYNGGLLAWAETRYDERWSNVDYSVVMTYNFQTGKKKQLTHQSRYFSPAPSPDGQKIAVVQVDEKINISILILNTATGEVMEAIPNSANNFYAHPAWIDNENIVIVAQNECGNWLEQVNISSGKREKLIPCTSDVIHRPVYANKYIFFDAGFDDIQNIYAVRLTDKETYQVTNARFGAFDPAVSPDGKHLAFADYDYTGYSIKEIEWDISNWQRIDLSFDKDLYGISFLQQHHQDITNTEIIDTPEIKKYNPFFNDLVNIYGWFPLPNIPEYGVEFYTLNLLRTWQSTVGVLYNTNENAFKSYGRIAYAALYPIVELEYGYNHRRINQFIPDTVQDLTTVDTSWFEHTLSAGVRLPFNLSKGIFSNNLELAAAYQYIQPDHITALNAYRLELIFSRLRNKSRQQINPRWGQEFKVKYQDVLDYSSDNIFATARLYFPGIMRSHTLSWSGAYRQQDINAAYRFADEFIYARGYEPLPYENIWLQSINYGMPLWYPDISLGSVAFLQRLRLNIFADHSEGVLQENTITQTSIGGELMLDLTLFRLAFASLGIQYTYRKDAVLETPHGIRFLFTRFELL